MANEYLEQAEQFLNDCDATLTVTYLYTGPHFDDDKEGRDVYSFVINSPRGVYSGKFGDSIHNTRRKELTKNLSGTYLGTYLDAAIKEYKKAGFKVLGSEGRGYSLNKKELIEARNRKPNAYDILSCLTKNDPVTFRNFCSDFGYDTDSRKAEKVYFAVQEEWEGVCKAFTPEQREALAEIN